MLHLPPLPSLVYDMAGILAFSIGRGYRLGTRGLKQDRLFLDVQKNAVGRNKERGLARQMLLALALEKSSGLKASPCFVQRSEYNHI